MNNRKKAGFTFSICTLLMVFAIVARIWPHPVNFTPVTAIGLFAGMYFNDRRFWLVPLGALLISDLIIGFYNPVSMLFVYSGFAFSALVGQKFLASSFTLARLGCTTVSSTIVFFVLSNMGVWLCGLYYPLNSTGLVECFVMALPFLGNSFLGDLFYVTCLFGLFEIMQKTNLLKLQMNYGWHKTI